jgi:CSLREA domain-containing protein
MMIDLFGRSKTILNVFILVAIAVSSTVMVSPVSAGTIIVNSTLDIEANDGLCTLREAIKAANTDQASGAMPGECAAGSGEDVISLPAGEYTLTATLAAVSTKMTILGEGAETTIIQASDCDPIALPGGCAPANNYRLLIVNISGDLTLEGVTLRYGNLTDTNSGGAIEIYKNLHLVDSIVSDNFAQNSGGGVFVRGGATVTITGSTILRNQASGLGGGIRNLGNLVITDSAFTENRSQTSQGGAIHSSANGSLEIINSSFENNFAHISGGGIFLQSTTSIENVITGGDFFENEVGTYGGAIYNSSNCNLEISDSILEGNVSGNYGGGISNLGAIDVMTTTFIGNNAVSGGGMYVGSSSTQTAITSSTFTVNIANNYGGAISSHGSILISTSQFTGNQAENYYGGAINLSGDTSSSVLKDSTLDGNLAVHGGGLLVYGTLEISGSTFVNNSAFGTASNGNGGAIVNQGGLNISNSTFSGNSAYIGGGIINNPGKTILLNNCTFALNQATGQGGGLYNHTDGILDFANTIITNSVSSTDCANYGSIVFNSHNLVEDGTCNANEVGFLSGDPLLAVLGDNGGPTQTHALMVGSPAIDAGDPARCPETDQRGEPRPNVFGCDIGAYESNPLAADFNAALTMGDAPLPVTFTNSSYGNYSTCLWDFGDGETSDTCGSPTHTYTTPGVYSVSLTVSGSSGTDTQTIVDYIHVYQPFQADFSASPTNGVAPLQVTFTNLSSGDYDTCAWTFGDGETSDDCGSPTHTYAMPGFYSVSLTVSGFGGTDTETKSNFIDVYQPVQADFSASPTNGVAPLQVTFTNLSTGDYESCSWTFGDGETSDDCGSPTHTYAMPGVYSVLLTVSGFGGTDTETKSTFIEVYQPVQADFSASPTNGVAPLQVTFTNLSSGAYDTCAWTFGDGETSDDCGSPTHTYAAPGVYSVSLTVSGQGGEDTETRNNYITVQDEPPVGYSIFLPLILK